jgi:hypothetical protein
LFLFYFVYHQGSGPELIEVLQNTEVLAVSGDPLGQEGVRLEDQHGTASSPDVFVGELSGGAFAAVFFNRGSANTNMTLQLADLSVVNADSVIDAYANGLAVRDLWRHTDNGTVATSGHVTAVVAPQDVVMLTLTPA